MPGLYFSNTQDDLNQRISRMVEGTFCLDAAQLGLLYMYNPFYIPEL